MCGYWAKLVFSREKIQIGKSYVKESCENMRKKMLAILFYFKSLFKMKASMLKIALSQGYKIRTSRTGREFCLWFKRSFLNQALCPHCICIIGGLSVNQLMLWMSHSSRNQIAWRFPSIYTCINI